MWQTDPLSTKQVWETWEHDNAVKLNLKITTDANNLSSFYNIFI